MRADQLKGCLVEVQKEEEEAEKAAEGAKAKILGPEGEETEWDRDTKNEKEMTHWEKVVDLVRAAFGEGWLAEEATW